MSNFQNGELKVNNHIIKIVGLLGVYPQKQRIAYQHKLLQINYKEDDASPEVKRFLKDQYYKDFREIMFEKRDNSEENSLLSRRFCLQQTDIISFVQKKFNQPDKIFDVSVIKSEIFFFGEEIALFSLSLKANPTECNIGFLNDLVFLIKQFDIEIISKNNIDEKRMKWHEFISEKYLAGTELRSQNRVIKVDNYSGSKFKTYCIIDGDIPNTEFESLLFDLGTSSPLNSSKGEGGLAPTEEYYSVVMQNKISVFKNWESLCLFDSFTSIGNNFIMNNNEYSKWHDTYFRIYLFRLFLKFNLFRYNSDLHDNTIKLRDQFEKFLNDYNLNHISFNFLPNEMYNQIGGALKLNEELTTFQERITRISAAIQEEKQSRMNMLLQAVAAISALSSVQPVIEGITLAQEKLGWGKALFYTILSILLIGISSGVLYFLFPDHCKKYYIKIFKKNKKQTIS